MAKGTNNALLGLSGSETAIYRAALELGRALPSELARRAGIKRPTLYKALPEILRKGLLTETVLGKRRYLVAEDPQAYLQSKRAELSLFEEQVPELRLLLNTVTIKPKLTFYEGIEGLYKLYMETLREKKPILEFVSVKNISPEIESYSRNYYIPQRINRKIPIKILVSGETTSNLIKLTNDPYALREVKSIDEKKFPIPLDCYVWGTNVALALYRKDSEPVGIVIRSTEVATMMRSLHTFLWENSPDR